MKPRKKMNGADRRNSIIEAAIPLFAQKGYNGTSVREIARAAEVSEALLYRHFPSKEKLHNEIFKFTVNISGLAHEEMEKMKPGAETLVKFVYIAAMLILFEVPGQEEDQAWHERLLFRSLQGDTRFARKHFKNIQDISGEKIEKCIEAAIANGDMVDIAVDPVNRMWFYHHLAMALNLCHLSDQPAFAYKGTKKDLSRQAILFSLRGMGMTDEAIGKYFRPKKLGEMYRKIIHR